MGLFYYWFAVYFFWILMRCHHRCYYHHHIINHRHPSSLLSYSKNSHWANFSGAEFFFFLKIQQQQSFCLKSSLDWVMSLYRGMALFIVRVVGIIFIGEQTVIIARMLDVRQAH